MKLTGHNFPQDTSSIDTAWDHWEQKCLLWKSAFPPLSEFDQQCFMADPLALAPAAEDIVCTEQEVFNLLNALDTNKAPSLGKCSKELLFLSHQP